MKTDVHAKACTKMFIAVLLIYNSHYVEPPKCLSVDEWTSRLQDIHTIEYYLVIKRNILKFL